MQKTLSIMKNDFCPLFTARSSIRSFGSHSHFSDFLDNKDQSLSLSVPQFPFFSPGNSVCATAQAEFLGCTVLLGVPSLLLTYSSFPHSLYFADELQLCN